jgi:hypothetical protein
MPTRYGRTRSLAVVVARVGVVALGIPRLGGLLVERRIGKQAQADDAGRVAVERADRLRRAVAERLAARADRDAGVLRLVLERIGSAVLGADVEPEAAALRVGRGRALEARLVDEPEGVPARLAVVAERGMRADDLEEIERAEGVAAHAVPEAVVAAAPDDPHVAAGDLGRVELDRAVHVVEVVVGRVLERRTVAARLLRLVETAPGCGPLEHAARSAPQSNRQAAVNRRRWRAMCILLRVLVRQRMPNRGPGRKPLVGGRLVRSNRG